MHKLHIAINRILCPSLSLVKFIRLAEDIGVEAIELRNDLTGTSLTDQLTTLEVRKLCEKSNISVHTINALQRFNNSSPNINGLERLLAKAKALGCKAVVLCPINGIEQDKDESCYITQATQALKAFGPLFEQNKIQGYIEPLGFQGSTLRTKASAWEAIQASGFSHCYKLVHDTFHHHLSGETEYYAKLTGLVHLSGVRPGKKKDELVDSDRILVDSDDVLGSKEQVHALQESGYDGLYSFEPFSSSVQVLSYEELKTALQQSIMYLNS